MKQFTFITIFFYCCTFASPPQAHAAVPAALIAVAAVGAVMGTTTAGTYYAQTGQTPQYVKTATDAVASAADAVFQPSYIAQAVGYLFTPQSLNTAKDYYVGKAAAVGASIGDIVDAVRNSASGAYTSLKNLIEANALPVSVSPTDFFNGVVVAGTDGTFFEVTADPWFSSYMTLATFNNNGSAYPKSTYSTLIWFTPSYINILNITQTSTNTYGATTYALYRANGKIVTKDETYKPSPGVSYPGLADSLANPSTDVANDLQQAIKDLSSAQKKYADAVPSTAGATTTAGTLTAAEVAQVLKDNAIAVAQAAATAAQEVVNSGATDAAAQIAALQTAVTAAQAAAQAATDAAEQAAQEEASPETFSPISASPFSAAYNPGAYDIPTRFTTFLQNVKSSGLFSFSSAFFDSLPGGGSPVYTVHAGRYGSHAIDLSDTMTTGLAVLKSILLACFGFLSIRAVIMKR